MSRVALPECHSSSQSTRVSLRSVERRNKVWLLGKILLPHQMHGPCHRHGAHLDATIQTSLHQATVPVAFLVAMLLCFAFSGGSSLEQQASGRHLISAIGSGGLE
jgi:hypothetical protein